MSHRAERLNELFRRELTTLVLGGLKDPRLTGVSITGVRAAKDLSFATVYVRDDGDVDAAIEGLEHASGFIRRQLGQVLRLRKIPEFRFVADETFEHASRIEELLRQTREDDAGREHD
ncbi:MAG: 30S ribosome-binding factor RbfA [Gemmatimonadetes bacterium]|nr:30S ribosome-binding factor RbfA [Gemmatimonadota bacterium]